MREEEGKGLLWHRVFFGHLVSEPLRIIGIVISRVLKDIEDIYIEDTEDIDIKDIDVYYHRQGKGVTSRYTNLPEDLLCYSYD